MAKLTIEDQVSQLTQEQQKKILKIHKVANIVASIIYTLVVIWIAFGMYLTFCPPITMDVDYTKIGLGIIGGGSIGVACVFAMLLFIKIKFPYYSEAKAKYIKRNHLV